MDLAKLRAGAALEPMFTERLTFRLTPEMYKRLDAACKKEGLVRGYVLRSLINEFLEVSENAEI